MSVVDVASIAVDATFGAFGHPALYRNAAGSPSVGCTVIIDTADRMVGAGSHFAAGAASPIAMGVIFQLRKSEVAKPKKGDILKVEGVVYKIISAPKFEDPERLVYSFTVDPLPQAVADSTTMVLAVPTPPTPTPPPSSLPALQFNQARNSMYRIMGLGL